MTRLLGEDRDEQQENEEFGLILGIITSGTIIGYLVGRATSPDASNPGNAGTDGTFSS